MAIEKVYRTTDGQTFENYLDARKHETSKTGRKATFASWLVNVGPSFQNYEDVDWSNLAEAIWNNFNVSQRKTPLKTVVRKPKRRKSK